MARALALARDAALRGEAPVGAVLVRAGRIVGEAANAMRQSSDPTAHAEMLALRLGGAERLPDCDLWVTLEPCAMCAGAIALARIRRLYYAAADPKGGAIEHGPRLFTQSTIHHRPEIYAGIGEADAAALLRAFFAERR